MVPGRFTNERIFPSALPVFYCYDCLEQKRLNHQNLNKISQMLQEIERISPDRIPAELQEKVTGLQDVLDNLRVRGQEFLTKHNELQKELLEKCDATVQVKSKAFADVKIQIGASFLTLFDPMDRVQFISHPKRKKVMAKPIKTEIKESPKNCLVIKSILQSSRDSSNSSSVSTTVNGIKLPARKDAERLLESIVTTVGGYQKLSLAQEL